MNISYNWLKEYVDFDLTLYSSAASDVYKRQKLLRH